MSEVWRPVVEYEDLYEVSTHGQVRSVDRAVSRLSRWGTKSVAHYKGRILKLLPDDEGRPTVALSKSGEVKRRHVSRLVAEAFVGNPAALPQVDHIDGNSAHNHVGNLRWVDPASNMRNKHRSQAQSGEMGVDFRRHCVNKPWRAQGTDRHGKPTHLGYFETKDEAAAAYRTFRAKNF